ncbi:hypothetical protein BDQ94DRAFT_104706 [Aspergillus welwitschiae]|uniref:Uncharacterized protein n=1 Tax=Aspergillus welwitschiae TaxID=1341132 RepID=A0A3F3QDA0_9EURO|nr:hypothetical protein BDQ94DRAFT_104706 [Aspergillus welwitschiae]RDH37019.1 hypothetical protein BDQ94DRAFT_104706 [Aspergillus welwitschiae]
MCRNRISVCSNTCRCRSGWNYATKSLASNFVARGAKLLVLHPLLSTYRRCTPQYYYYHICRPVEHSIIWLLLLRDTRPCLPIYPFGIAFRSLDQMNQQTGSDHGTEILFASSFIFATLHPWHVIFPGYLYL